MTQRIGLEIGHESDSGRQRDLNEDSYLVLTPPAVANDIQALLAVADGMGGHQAGDVASQALVDALNRTFSSPAYQEDVAYSSSHPDYYIVVLKDILERINERICDLSIGRSELSGMGTTATVLLLARGSLFWGHVGDSRAYLFRNGEARQLTPDQTWVAEQVAAGHLTWEEAMHHPRRHQLTQSLGNSLLIRVARGMNHLREGDVVVLCTDGLTNCVNVNEIQRTLLKAGDLQTGCSRLVDLANQRGGPDNITVVAVRCNRNAEGSNVIGGRIVGPKQRTPSSSVLPDTLKIQRRLRRSVPKRFISSLRTLLVLFVSSLSVAAITLFLQTGAYVPVPSRQLGAMTSAIMFLLGTFLGWLLRSTHLKDEGGENEK